MGGAQSTVRYTASGWTLVNCEKWKKFHSPIWDKLPWIWKVKGPVSTTEVCRTDNPQEEAPTHRGPEDRPSCGVVVEKQWSLVSWQMDHSPSGVWLRRSPSRKRKSCLHPEVFHLLRTAGKLADNLVKPASVGFLSSFCFTLNQRNLGPH